MKKNLCMLLTVAACVLMVPGCGMGNGAGKNEDSGLQETPAASSTERETETLETAGAVETDAAADAYGRILDMFYYKILGGWDRTEDVSYMFYWDYTSVHDLSDAGYALTDLDGNGVPELIVSPVQEAGDGMIFDLYTLAGKEAVHAATSGERYCYYLCGDNTIYYWGSSGAGNSTQINYSIDPDTGLLHPDEVVAFNQDEYKNNPWFYGTPDHYDRAEGHDFESMSHITEEEAENICGGWQPKAIELTTFDKYTPQGGMPAELLLKQAFRSAAGTETELYFVCDDFDGDGTAESFGMTGTDDGIDLRDVKIYYIDSEAAVSCIDTIPVIYGYGGITSGINWVMDAGNAKFLKAGGADGQETWLYGARDGKAYQPEVSGQHADFRKADDGRYIAQPHEGGEGYYIIYYNFDPATGEFVPEDGESRDAVPQTEKAGPGHEHSYTGTVTAEPACVTGGIRTYTCPCGDTYTEEIEPTGHDWETHEELVSSETNGSVSSTLVKWVSVCRICGATRNF